MKKTVLSFVAAALVLGTIEQCIAQDSLLVAPGDVIDGKVLQAAMWPSINDLSQVVFHGFSSEGMGIFLVDATTGGGRLLVTSGDVIDGKELISAGWPSINVAGEVAFAGMFSEKSGIFVLDATTGDGRLLVATGDVIDGKELIGTSWPSINDSGEVAFLGYFSEGTGIFLVDTTTGERSLLAATGDVIDGKELQSSVMPSINDSGEVAFVASFSEGLEEMGIFLVDTTTGDGRLLVAPGDVIDGKELLELGAFSSMNDWGEVAFLGVFSEGMGIFQVDTMIGDGRLLVTSGDVIGGEVLYFADYPSISASGEVAFMGYFSEGVGIFLLSPPPPPSPQGMILNLIDTITGMDLHEGIANALQKKLRNVLFALESDNADRRNDAVRKLLAFINAVEAQRGKKISEAAADELIDEAFAAIELVEQEIL